MRTGDASLFRRKREASPVLCLLLAGCGAFQAYEGSSLPAAERAVVHADPAFSAGLPVQVILRKVDEYAVPAGRAMVALRPGLHLFLVDCRVTEAGTNTRFNLEAEVEAGGSYRLVPDATARGCDGVELRPR